MTRSDGMLKELVTEVKKAKKRIGDRVRQTYLQRSEVLSETEIRSLKQLYKI